jgi:putative restriction endonuclease
MAKAIFTTKINPSYKDLPELMYHFPKTYLRQVNSTIGDWIIYYEPRREDSLPGGRAGRQCYFAAAQVSDIKEDPILKDHYYAYIEGYIEFSSPVPFRVGSLYYESRLKKADGSTNKGAFGRSVRNIPDEEYQFIIAAGLGKVKQEIAQMVAEEQIEYNVQRPIVQQLVERQFREAAFSRIVKEGYEMTCAMSGISIKNEHGAREIEAAHIKPVKFNGPDSIRNGIALCRTFHWMFDNGLLSVADNNEILVKKIVPDRVRQLINIDGRMLRPENRNAVPHPEFLKFHRENIYNLGMGYGIS